VYLTMRTVWLLTACCLLVIAAPRPLTAKPGQKVRLRVVNASSDTIFKLALQGHRLTVTHTDGFPVTPTQASAVYLAMGERLDATITLGDGVFVLQAAPEGKKGTPARAIVRTGSGNVPAPDTRIAELDGKALLTTQLKPADSARLPDRTPDPTLFTFCPPLPCERVVWNCTSRSEKGWRCSWSSSKTPIYQLLRW